MKQNGSKLLVGSVIVAVGIYIILSAAGIELPLLFAGWWTLPIIIIGAVSVANNGLNGGNLAMLAVGVWLLANQRGWIPGWFNGGYVAGAAVLLFGFVFLFNSRQSSKSEYREHDSENRDRSYTDTDSDEQRNNYKRPLSNNPHREDSRERESSGYRRGLDTDPNPNYTSVFSGQDVKNVSSNLDSCTLFALFGGLTVDFRGATIDHDVIIDASALFGGIDLRFPDTVRVDTRATPIFGGVDNKSREPSDPNAPVVTVRCLAAFGGIDIK